MKSNRFSTSKISRPKSISIAELAPINISHPHKENIKVSEILNHINTGMTRGRQSSSPLLKSASGLLCMCCQYEIFSSNSVFIMSIELAVRNQC